MYLLLLLPLCLAATLEEEDGESDIVTVADVPDVPDNPGLGSYFKWTQSSLHEHHEAPVLDNQEPTIQERSLAVPVISFGWIAGTAVLIFAFANTVIIGSTMFVTYTIYQILVSVLAVVAPQMAQAFADLFP